MRRFRLYRLMVLAMASALALAACKKDEPAPAPPETADAPPPPMEAPADTMPPPDHGPAVQVTSVTVGNHAADDKTVAAMDVLSPSDTIIVSIKTDGEASNVDVSAKLTFQDGQVAGEQGATLNTQGAETTNISFSHPDGWPVGKYDAEVMVDGKPAGTSQAFEVK